MSWRKKTLFAFGALVAIVILGLGVFWGVKKQWDAHYLDGYDPEAPLQSTNETPEKREGYLRIAFQFDGLPGEGVPSLLALPLEGEGAFPCCIFLHGIGQEKEFLDEIALPFVENGFALVSFDQYTRGERRQKGLGPLGQLKALYRRGSLTVVETRRLIDYLESRDDIDSGRVYMCGASYGAMTGCTASALDQRIKATVLCYGGGDLKELLNNQAALDMIAEEPKGNWILLAVKLTRPLFAWLFRVFDPCLYVGGISPRPVFFQNGTHDVLIPTGAAKAFHAAAKAPKEILWYDSDHVGMDRKHTEKVLYDAISWLEEQDSKSEERELE